MQEKIESATDVLKTILNTVMDEIEEISWPPKDPKSLILMEKVNHKLETSWSIGRYLKEDFLWFQTSMFELLLECHLTLFKQRTFSN